MKLFFLVSHLCTRPLYITNCMIVVAYPFDYFLLIIIDTVYSTERENARFVKCVGLQW